MILILVKSFYEYMFVILLFSSDALSYKIKKHKFFYVLYYAI